MLNDLIQKELELKNVYNLRELGGFITANGRTTRFKRFLRSDNTDKLPEKEIQSLKDYGVKTVIDLRSEREAIEVPDKLKGSGGIKYYNIKICPPSGLKEEITLPELYLELIKNTEKNMLKDIFDVIADNVQDGVVLFHCTHGKDRTGILSALLLRLVGVSKQDISADYAKSFELMRDTESMKKLIAHRGKEFSYSEPEYIENVLDYVESTYGGIEEYLLDCGVSEENINKIKKEF